jgi:hypothetical protein
MGTHSRPDRRILVAISAVAVLVLFFPLRGVWRISSFEHGTVVVQWFGFVVLSADQRGDLSQYAQFVRGLQ